MATISVSLPSDGDTADVADYNVPINTIVTAINGNIDADNIEAGGVTPAALVSGTGTSWAWQSWTPTLSGRFDDAKWTKTCKYIQIGKTVHARLKLVASTTTPMSGGSTDAIFTLPVTAVTGSGGGDVNSWIGGAGFYDSGTAVYAGSIYLDPSDLTKARVRFHLASGTNLTIDAITSTAPFTWTTSDEIVSANITYEAA